MALLANLLLNCETLPQRGFWHEFLLTISVAVVVLAVAAAVLLRLKRTDSHSGSLAWRCMATGGDMYSTNGG